MPARDTKSIYADSFRDHSEGLAIYDELSINKVMPGSCGYFDLNGDWQDILNVTDVKAAGLLNLPPLSLRGFPKEADGIETEWGVRLSKNVKEESVDCKVEAEYEAFLQNTENLVIVLAPVRLSAMRWNMNVKMKLVLFSW
jgi:hypothetical protein